MVTAGGDGLVKIWDLRTYKMKHSYFLFTKPTCLDVSQRGILAVGGKGLVQVTSAFRKFFFS